jgi:hypothetical protein
VIEQSREAKEFIEAIGVSAPTAVSSRDGWTSHEIAAHVAGIAVESTGILIPSCKANQFPPFAASRSAKLRCKPLTMRLSSERYC